MLVGLLERCADGGARETVHEDQEEIAGEEILLGIRSTTRIDGIGLIILTLSAP